MASPQPARIVPIVPKITAARTQYYDLKEEDADYIYRWLIRFLADSAELATQDTELQREWFKRRPRQLPKGRNGPNSIASFIGGIISARVQNPEHNLSEPLLDHLESIFDMIATMYADNEQPPETIRFRKNLFE